jgi:predicted nucleic acid-binding protein
MAVNYTIQADIVDIRGDSPQPDDSFLVDTNVWLWLTYTRALAAPHQTRDYPPYIQKARTAQAILLWCGLSLAELAHNIERIQRDIYNSANGLDLKSKEYRHNYPAEQSGVVAEIQSAWGLVKTIALPLELQVDEPTTDLALNRLNSQFLDGYDLFMLAAMDRAGVTQIITDDGDYVTVPGIQVFTSNQNVIREATRQKKLLRR